MKTVHLMIAAAFLLLGTNLAGQANPVPQQAAPQTGEKSANNQQNDAVRNEKDQARSGEGDVDEQPSAGVTRARTKHPPTTIHSKTDQSHRPRPTKTPTTSNLRSETYGCRAALKQTGSEAVTAVPNRAVSHRSPSAPPFAVSVNGHQFRNSLNPGAHLAVSGGPPTPPRGTAAINGINMKRKP